MWSKEEAKEIREEFWGRFKSYSSLRRKQKKLPSSWTLSNTGIKALNLKFHIDLKVAQVGIDLETRNLDKRLELFERLEAVKKVLEEEYMKCALTWELDYERENGKSISRIYVEKDGIDIYDRETWPEAFKFMHTNMMRLEAFYDEYRDYIKNS